MRRILASAVSALFLFPLICGAQALSGPWKGEIDVRGSKLALVLHLDAQECTMDSPDQGVKGIPAEVEFISADSVSVSSRQIGARFSGRLQDGKIVGRFSQGGLSMPLVLSPGEMVRHRPQTPQPPFPYSTEEVYFVNGASVLSGTLTYPERWNGRKKVPVAIMVTGSGQQNRDEELMGHKPFFVIADYLARHGIATLRYDDRGFGSSIGDVSSSTTEDNMEDALAGINLLRTMGKFSSVGVIGHSEGGLIAFMLGARKKVDFLVSLAGPGVQGDSILLLQNLAALRRSGLTMQLTKEYVRSSVKAQGNPWLDFFIDYDPADDIRQIRCPALILCGEKDTQVEAAVNIPTIEANLPRNRRTVVKVYPDLNHLFQHCDTGQADEYSSIEETISPEVLEDIATWINKL